MSGDSRMYRTSSLFIPGGGSGGSSKGDGLKTDSGSGVGKDLESELEQTKKRTQSKHNNFNSTTSSNGQLSYQNHASKNIK